MAKLDARECGNRGFFFFRRFCRKVDPMLANLSNEMSMLNSRKGCLQDENERGWMGTDKEIPLRRVGAGLSRSGNSATEARKSTH